MAKATATNIRTAPGIQERLGRFDKRMQNLLTEFTTIRDGLNAVQDVLTNDDTNAASHANALVDVITHRLASLTKDLERQNIAHHFPEFDTIFATGAKASADPRLKEIGARAHNAMIVSEQVLGIAGGLCALTCRKDGAAKYDEDSIDRLAELNEVLCNSLSELVQDICGDIRNVINGPHVGHVLTTAPINAPVQTGATITERDRAKTPVMTYLYQHVEQLLSLINALHNNEGAEGSAGLSWACIEECERIYDVVEKHARCDVVSQIKPVEHTAAPNVSPILTADTNAMRSEREREFLEFMNNHLRQAKGCIDLASGHIRGDEHHAVEAASDMLEQMLDALHEFGRFGSPNRAPMAVAAE